MTGSLGPVRSILVIKLSAVGDIVMATPAVDHLKRATGARITWAVDEGMASLLADHPLVDDLLLFPRDPFENPLTDLRRFPLQAIRELKRLRSREFDLAIDFQGRGRTYLMLQAARARRKIGRGRFPFLSERVPHRRSVVRHAVWACFEPLDLLGLARPDQPRLVLPSHEADRAKVAGWLEAGRCAVGSAARRRLTSGRFVALLPATTWPSKLWPAEHWIRTINHLNSQDTDVVVIGGKLDSAWGERLRSGVEHPERVFPLFGDLNLRELVPLFEASSLVIGVDTGPLHIAAATATPIVALYGPTDPLRTGPWPPGRASIISAPECRQCRLPRCRKKCMLRLLPEEVIAALGPAPGRVTPWSPSSTA
jgi:heptosyltransferase-1